MPTNTREFICYISYRLFMPIVLAVAAFIRISFLSLVWLVFFLALPCLPTFSGRNWIAYRSLRIYVLLLLSMSTLACCGHLVYWVLEVSTSQLDISVATMCNSSTNILLIDIGYQSLSPEVVPNVLDRVRLVMPDCVVFVVSVVTTILSYKSIVSGTPEEGRLSKAWRRLESPLTALLLFLAGSTAPSLISGVYFGTFVMIGSVWALGVKLCRLPYLKLPLLVVSGLQIIALYLYQFKDIHTWVKRDAMIARLLGLVPYYNRACEFSDGTLTQNPLHLTFTDSLIFGNFAFVFCLTALYFYLGISASSMIKGADARVGVKTGPVNTRRRSSRRFGFPISPDGENSAVKRGSRVSELKEDRGDGVEKEVMINIALEDQVHGSVDSSIHEAHTSSHESCNPEENQGTFKQILRFTTRLMVEKVFLLTLAVLMLWSISYRSWLEFVLLLLVCFLCVSPKAKEASYSVAYPLVGYCTILVTIQYIYSLDLHEDELVEWEDVGLQRYKQRGHPVFFKTIFLAAFWLHLRAYLYQKSNIVNLATSSIHHNRYTVKLYRFYRNIKYVTLHYWQAVCYGTLLTAALHSQGINIVRIIYLLFFIVFMLCYLVVRKPLKLRVLWLWYMLILHVMFCVILLYTYQFTQIRNLWTSNMNVDVIEDIGLSVVSAPSQLFLELLVPILVLWAVKIQLLMFRAPPQEEELEIVEETEPETVEKDAEPLERTKSQKYMTNLATNVTDTLKEFWSDSKTVAARAFHISLAIMEMHSPKFVLLAVFWVCVWRVNVINLVLLLITVVTLPWPVIQYKLTIPIFCWVWWEVFTQLIYQLKMVKAIFNTYLEPYITILPCNHNDSSAAMWQCGYKDKSDVEWLGYYSMQTDDTTNNLLDLENKPWGMVWGYVLIITLLVVQRLLVHYMKGRRSPHVYILRESIFPDFVFPKITRESTETKLSLKLMLYLCNNFFVLFGKEIVYIMHVLVAAVRCDVYGFIYIVLLGIWKNLSAKNKSRTCMAYIVLINVLISIQYILLVGLPPSLCLEYPWCALQTPEKSSILIWLYLPTTPSTSNHYFLFADFVLLLCLSRMWHVFSLQKLDGSLAGALSSSAGPDYADPRNTATLNKIKFFIFTYSWWVTTMVLFLNAAMTVSIFSTGFLIATFVLLGYGSRLLTKPKKVLLSRWEIILVYIYFVVLFKILLQLPSCVDFHFDSHTFEKLRCPLSDIFKLICHQEKPELLTDTDGPFMRECNNNYNKSTGLLMDALTFMFVMIQIKVFSSHYFKHAQHYLEVLRETSAQGAMIMKHRMSLRTKMNFDAEEKRIKHIKEHVASLKAEHNSNKSFDFEIKELTTEALEYWAERGRNVLEAARKRTQTNSTYEERHGDPEKISVLENDEEGSCRGIEGDVGGDGPDEDQDEPIDPGSNIETRTNETPKEVPIRPRPPKPHKQEKPTEESIVEVLEFSHQSLVSFLEFAIRWLDDKSADYRYTSTAIFEERYNVMSPRAGNTLFSTIRNCNRDEGDILEEGDPSCSPSGHIFWRLCVAFHYFCLARTELLCFFFMILNHIMNASIISMFYPVVAFLWGMVAFPRPSGIFWYIVIVYCKISIICKYVFQFDTVITWNANIYQSDQSSDPMWLPNLLGLTNADQLLQSTACDLFILMSVFFHKTCLETAGIWSVWYNTFDDVEDGLKKPESRASPASSSSTTRMIGNEEEEMETSLVDDLQEPKGAMIHESHDGDHSNNLDVILIEETLHFTKLAKLNFVTFWKLLVDKGRTKKDMSKDLYLSMFIASLLTLLVTLLGWDAFGKVEEDLDVSQIIYSDYIPSVFLCQFLCQFMLMIVDRIIYLKKSMVAKYAHQVLVVITLHAYLFFFQPWFTGESFQSMVAWIVWYIFWCWYFTLSAFQIQSGYPRLTTDSIILRTYGYVSYVIYMGYLYFPFLWELGVLLNWICTETTLSFGYWLKYSDIKTWLFKLKHWQVTYESSAYLGKKQPASMKYGIGGLILLVLILIMWFPLLFMSFAATNSLANSPVGFSCSLSISGFGLKPLVNLRVEQMPDALSDEQLDEFKREVARLTINDEDYRSQNNYSEFVGKFKYPDVVKLDLLADSTTLWEISPGAVKHLKKYLRSTSSTNNLTMRFDWTIIRAPGPESSASESVSGYSEIPILSAKEAINSSTPTKTFVSKTLLLGVIENCTSTEVNISGIIPTYLYAKEGGPSSYVDLFPGINAHNLTNLKSATLLLNSEYADSDTTQCKIWNDYYWSFDQKEEDHILPNINKDTDKVQFYIFSDRVISSQYQQLINGKGIIGLYLSVVFVIWRFIRMNIADSPSRIIFQEMPSPDLIMELVGSMEMARAQSEYVLEQMLFAKLLLLYRSPETLIVWTGKHRHLKEE